jgi:hypothetical protein
VSNDLRAGNGRFLPGHANIGGRPLGSRNTLAARVLDTFLKDFEAHGAPALVAVREKSPIDTGGSPRSSCRSRCW